METYLLEDWEIKAWMLDSGNRQCVCPFMKQ